MNLKLVKMSDKYKDLLYNMMDELTSATEVIKIGAIIRKDYKGDWNDYINSLEIKEIEIINGFTYVPESTYFCLDVDRNVLLGVISIRHFLTENLLLYGGNIGYEVRPSERRKGVATQMLRLALIECSKLNISDVLVTCNKTNIASAKVIQANGGVLENEVVKDDEDSPIVFQRYWIHI